MCSRISASAVAASPATIASITASCSSRRGHAGRLVARRARDVGVEDLHHRLRDELEDAIPRHRHDGAVELVRHRAVGGVVVEVDGVRPLAELGQLGSLIGTADGRRGRAAHVGSSARRASTSSRYVAPDDVQVQREHAAEHRGVHRLHHRAAARAGLQAHEPVELEHPQRLAQRSAPDVVLLHHLGLGRQAVARLEPLAHDVVHDGLRHNF